MEKNSNDRMDYTKFAPLAIEKSACGNTLLYNAPALVESTAGRSKLAPQSTTISESNAKRIGKAFIITATMTWTIRVNSSNRVSELIRILNHRSSIIPISYGVLQIMVACFYWILRIIKDGPVASVPADMRQIKLIQTNCFVSSKLINSTGTILITPRFMISGSKGGPGVRVNGNYTVLTQFLLQAKSALFSDDTLFQIMSVTLQILSSFVSS